MRAIYSLNRYTYVGNNPLKYVDPTGHCFGDSIDCQYINRMKQATFNGIRDLQENALEYVGIYYAEVTSLALPIEEAAAGAAVAIKTTGNAIKAAAKNAWAKASKFFKKSDDVIERTGNLKLSDDVLINPQNTGGTNPLANIQYTDKVKKQMQQGDFHSFPDIVDNYGGMGKVTQIKGGDGITRTKVEIPGSYKGRDGVFEYIIEPDGVTVNHRLFKPN